MPDGNYSPFPSVVRFAKLAFSQEKYFCYAGSEEKCNDRYARRVLYTQHSSSDFIPGIIGLEVWVASLRGGGIKVAHASE